MPELSYFLRACFALRLCGWCTPAFGLRCGLLLVVMADGEKPTASGLINMEILLDDKLR